MWELGLVIFLHKSMSKFTANELIFFIKKPFKAGEKKRGDWIWKGNKREKWKAGAYFENVVGIPFTIRRDGYVEKSI